jgi:integrase
VNTKIGKGLPINKVTLKDGSVRYRVRLDAGVTPGGSRRQVHSTHRTLQDAKDALAQTRVTVKTGEYVAPNKATLAAYLTGWVDGKRGLRATTRQGYRALLRPVVKELGRRSLQQVTKADVDTLIAHLLATGGRAGTGRSARSVNLLLTVWGQAIDSAVKERLVPQNVVALVERPWGEPTVVGQAWSAEQGQALLAVAGAERLAGAWRLTMCGLRRGEVLGLTWACVDLDAATARIEFSRVLLGGKVVTNPPKTRAGVRVIPLLPEIVSDLRGLRRLQAEERLALGPAYRDSEGLVFVDPKGIPIRPEAYSDEFKRLTGKAGLPIVRLHDARHTAASMLDKRGVRPTVAAALLGHDVAIYSRIYVHADAEDIRAAMQALGDAWAGMS